MDADYHYPMARVSSTCMLLFVFTKCLYTLGAGANTGFCGKPRLFCYFWRKRKPLEIGLLLSLRCRVVPADCLDSSPDIHSVFFTQETLICHMGSSVPCFYVFVKRGYVDNKQKVWYSDV